MGERFLARDLPVELAQARGAGGARSRQRRKSESGHHGCGAAVPDVWNDEDAWLVQGAKAQRLVVLVLHRDLLADVPPARTQPPSADAPRVKATRAQAPVSTAPARSSSGRTPGTDRGCGRARRGTGS